MSPGVVLADAAYGNDSGFRQQLGRLGLEYVVGVQSSTTVWRPGEEPLPAAESQGAGRPPKRWRRSAERQPVSVKQWAMELGRGAFRRLSWRAGTKQPLRSRFAAVRVRAAHRDYGRDEPHPQQWLLIEWPTKEAKPIQYWLANLPEKTKSKDLVAAAKQRWIIERDYQELKQELGLGHYEGRGWRHCSDPSPSRRGRSVRAGRPIRAERHNPTSIATRRTQLAHHIPPQLERCPFCGSVFL